MSYSTSANHFISNICQIFGATFSRHSTYRLHYKRLLEKGSGDNRRWQQLIPSSQDWVESVLVHYPQTGDEAC